MTSKFEIGDRVRHPQKGLGTFCGYGSFGDTSHGIKYDNWFGGHDLSANPETARIANTKNQGWYELADSLELISSPQYTPITPKVGEKYRVMKKIPHTFFDNPLNVIEYKGGGIFYESVEGLSQSVTNKHLTTEYLELVEEPITTLAGEVGDFYITTTDGAGIYIDANAGINIDANAGISIQETINQSIIQKSMSFIKRLTQSKDDKALLKARFTDDCGNLTSHGQDALTSLVFAEKKAELVKLAEEVIAEEKE